MRITFIAHASILIEASGVSILSDPWWSGPCFGAQWWLHPAPFVEPIVRRPPDYIYISHGHHDHFHPTTLKLFDRRTPIVVSRALDLEPAIRALGFPVIALGDDEECRLGELRCRVIHNAGDTLMTVTDGWETCVNANDALHACPREIQDRFIGRLRDLLPRLDYLFCGYGIASHFPNCYVLPRKDRAASAIHRQRHFNRTWARIVAGLAPRFAFPFAADVIFLDEDLFWSNVPVHNAERPTDVFRRDHPDAATTVIDIAPGFVVEDGAVVTDRRRQPVSATALRALYEDSIRRVNRHAVAAPDTFAHLLALFRDNVERCRPYLVTFPGDYRALIRLKGCDQAIRVVKAGDTITVQEAADRDAGACDIVYTTRSTYLRSSLTTAYGYEVLFVGSGGIFEYRDTARLDDQLHRELAVMMRPADQCPAPRPMGVSARLRTMKRALRSLLRPAPPDLYDLRAWTVFDALPGRADGR